MGRGSGCQHDGEMVWSSDTCDPGTFGADQSSHVVVQGGKHRGDEACPDECESGWAHGDCLGLNGCSGADLTRHLPTGGCHFDPCVGTDSRPGSCAIAPRDAAGGGSCIMEPEAGHTGPYSWQPANKNEAQCAVGQSVCDDAAYRAGGGSNQCVNGKRICGAASSSTVGWGGEPDRALIEQLKEDGTPKTAWNQMGCTHTDAGDMNERNVDGSLHGPAWWQVDLGQTAIIQHVDLWHRTDCCQDRLQAAGIYVSDTPEYTSGVMCGRLSDHTQAPEVSQCGSVTGRYVTVAHDHSVGGGSSNGVVVTICRAQVFGIPGGVDTASCTCTPRCAQDTLNMAVRCCADTSPVEAGGTCASKVPYSGPLKPALTGSSSWYMYLLYAVLAVIALAALVKLSPLLLAKIASGGKGGGGGGSGLASEGLAPDAGSSIYGCECGRCSLCGCGLLNGRCAQDLRAAARPAKRA